MPNWLDILFNLIELVLLVIVAISLWQSWKTDGILKKMYDESNPVKTPAGNALFRQVVGSAVKQGGEMTKRRRLMAMLHRRFGHLFK